MGRRNQSSYIEAVIEDVCGELGLAVPPPIDSGVVIDPGPKTADSIVENMERSIDEGRSATLSDVTDINRCAVIVPNYAAFAGTIKKLKQKSPCLRGGLKNRDVSLYVGFHFNGKSNEIPFEIQMQDPLLHRIKHYIADVNYRKTRRLTSLTIKAAREGLNKKEKELLITEQQEYEFRCKQERRLFTMLREATDINDHVEEISSLIKYCNGIGDVNCEPEGREPYSPLLHDWQYCDKKGNLDEPKLRRAIGVLNPYLVSEQKALCKRAKEPIRSCGVILPFGKY